MALCRLLQHGYGVGWKVLNTSDANLFELQHLAILGPPNRGLLTVSTAYAGQLKHISMIHKSVDMEQTMQGTAYVLDEHDVMFTQAKAHIRLSWSLESRDMNALQKS